jgi:glutathione synthase/RimK-type ligase-like ATP-grasp enzyme
VKRRKIVIVPYRYSEGCVRLAETIREMGIPCRRHPKSICRGDLVVNWGNSSPGNLPVNCRESILLNHPECVLHASNKLFAFMRLREGGVSTPRFAITPEEAKDWNRVVCRSRLRASGGAGIIIKGKGEELPEAPLYVEYIPKDGEYRAHVFMGEVIAFQKKVRATGGNADPLVRNHSAGWVYSRNVEAAPEIRGMVCSQAIAAVSAINLSFGAADVIYSRKKNAAFVLEVNTAPGIEGSTVLDYANAITSVFTEAK